MRLPAITINAAAMMASAAAGDERADADGAKQHDRQRNVRSAV
jgi:hypothetical protein